MHLITVLKSLLPGTQHSHDACTEFDELVDKFDELYLQSKRLVKTEESIEKSAEFLYIQKQAAEENIPFKALTHTNEFIIFSARVWQIARFDYLGRDQYTTNSEWVLLNVLLVEDVSNLIELLKDKSRRTGLDEAFQKFAPNDPSFKWNTEPVWKAMLDAYAEINVMFNNRDTPSKSATTLWQKLTPHFSIA